MKKILSALVRWTGVALVAAALLPNSLRAAQFIVQNITVNETGTYHTGDPIYFWVDLVLSDPNDRLDESTVPEDFALNFLLADGTSRAATFVSSVYDPGSGAYALGFEYYVQETDYTEGSLPNDPPDYQGAALSTPKKGRFSGSVGSIKNMGGDSLGMLIATAVPTNPLEKQSGIETLAINPENATIFTINFVDEYGEKFDNKRSFTLYEGDEAVPYVINIGAKPQNPIPVVVDWTVANVFGEAAIITNYVEEAQQIFYIERVFDDGAVPVGASQHEYPNIKAYMEGRNEATMKAIVKNKNPVITGFLGSVVLSTNTVLAVDQEISVTAQIEDPSHEQLDEPLTITWRFGSRSPVSVTNNWMGSYWESTAIGTVPEGYSTVSVSVTDKDRGTASTNAMIYAEAGPLLKADPADVARDGLSNLGDGTIEILQPGSGSIEWVPVYGNHLPSTATLAVLRANPFTAAESDDQYDSFRYKWYNEEDEGLEKNDPTRGLKSGYEPIDRTGVATVNLLADDSASFADRAPMDRVIQYYFSREKFRPDNFGDIDGDRLGDEWEIFWFSQSAKNFTDPITGDFVRPAESGAPVRADGATLQYDFSGSGNMDGDGLPANCYEIHDYEVAEDIVRDDGSVLIPAGTYSVQSFAYPLPAKSVEQYGYLPLGGTHMVGFEEEKDVIAFRANSYVSQNALKSILVDFNNELEFRGVSLYQGFTDEAGETIDFRPVGDGDEPNTDPMSADTDGDGMSDGWEYYFWAVAYYNIGSDQWLAFDGAAPAGGSFQGTGAPISRDDILATFNPTSAAFADEDIDHDGLTNLEEFALGTNPLHWDTDGDGLPDGWEVEFGFKGGTGTTVTTDPVTGETTTTVDNTSTIVLNPLKADGNNNDDGDWFAISGNLRHYDVFLSYDFDPRTGWCNPNTQTVSYNGYTFQTEYPNTDKFTALEEFNLGAWFVERGEVASLQGTDPNAANYWGKWCSNPLEPDTDGNGIPDGWEAYVGLHPATEPPGNPEGTQDLEQDENHPNGDGLNNLHEFLCVMAARQYDYIAEKYQDEIDEWPNKVWPTNPNPSAGPGYAHGGDTDNDQVLDSFEKGPNCNPTCCDTDHDYLPDLWECYFGTDPLVRDALVDYDGDGLYNWQEYLAGAVWNWQYDKWYNAFRGTKGPDYGEVDMWDFFVDPDNQPDYEGPSSNRHGGFGRAAQPWDCASGAGARQSGVSGDGAPFFFISAEARSGTVDPKLVGMEAFNGYGFTARGTTEDRSVGTVLFATTDPWHTDSDRDGLDDYYEAFHGLNPLYGGTMLDPDYDRVGMTDPDTGSEYPSEPWDLVSYPWLVGDPNADPDKDGLTTREESAGLYVGGGSHHTDPSPYWITDGSYQRSFVNLYYQPGATFATTMPLYWYWGNDGGGAAPRYAFSFETNEGYDTDNDNVGDRSELTTDELLSRADPLDFDNPRRRKAMYFNGAGAACRTRGAYSTDDADELRTFTVEAWICPIQPAAGHVQTIIERSAIVPQDTAQGGTSGKRLNFRLSITEEGALRGEFHNYQGAHFTMETDVASAGLRAGVWTHVAMTYSGTPAESGFLTIYVNGEAKKSEASSLQAFNGYLQDYSVAYNASANEIQEESRYRVASCPIILGSSDLRPSGVVNGFQTFADGTISAPGQEPVLTDFFLGWMDEVRIWDGARSREGIYNTRNQRFDQADVARWASATDKVAGRPVSLRHHYTFDNLPDVVPAPERSAEAYLYPSDVEALPTGLAEVFTAPNDGSYPGIPWWNASSVVSIHYDRRNIPWIEDSCVHASSTEVVDAPRIVAATNGDGEVVGYREYVFSGTFEPRSRTVLRYDGVVTPSSQFPMGRNPYGCGYNTAKYVEDFPQDLSSTNGETRVVNGGYNQTEGQLDSGDAEWWYADLLPLGGAVADMDVELWDAKGVGYELATVDSDGDGIPDWWETLHGLDPFDKSDAWEDWDGDGLDNLAEFRAGTDPSAGDSDGDGYPDYNDRDTSSSLTYGEQFDDGDNMPSDWEVAYGLNPRLYDADDDLDGDGWSNYSEYLAGTAPDSASVFPEPPLLATIHYDGDKTDGTLVIYAYGDDMKGRPDAVFTQAVQSKDAGVLTVSKEYLATLQEGVTHYEGKLALGNIVNDDTFVIEGYSTEAMVDQSMIFTGNAMAVPASFYCPACGKSYAYSQMTQTEVPYICPRGHSAQNVDIIASVGYTAKLSTNMGDLGYIDYATGEWYVDIENYPDDFAGMTLTASYTTSQGSSFSFPMRRKWTSTVDTTSGLISSGHLREGATRFFAFLDTDGDLLFDEGEPAGMALYQTIMVGPGAVEIEIPLTDFLTGFPRLSWEPVENASGYSIRLGVTGNATLNGYVLDAGRTFLMEQDLLSYRGVNLGSGSTALLNWDVRPFFGDSATAPGDAIASGVVTNSVSSTTRKALAIISPAKGSVVSDAAFELRWTMDYRNEGVTISIKNNGTGATSSIYCLPRRVGSLSEDYYYVIEPQKLFEQGRFLALADGSYTLTVTEQIRSTATTAKSASVNFVIDRAGTAQSNAAVDATGSISGTVTYYGKIPYGGTEEVVGTFDGVSTKIATAIGHSPVPGTVTVSVRTGGKTVFSASDAGAREGLQTQGLYSTDESLVESGSYVVYGDTPAVSLQLASPPVAGSQLVVSYKQYSNPIRIQAFAVPVGGAPSFSGVPAAQINIASKGAFSITGLPAGTYCVRAFIDQNGDSILNGWESVGYAMAVVRSDVGIWNFALYDVPPGASDVGIVIHDKDTDNDDLPDAWEYYHFQSLTKYGGSDQRQAGLYLWQEYADGELDSDPNVEDTDGDGLPDSIEINLLATNTHSWDTDGDGIGDLEEFLSGSDPRDMKDARHFASPAPAFRDDGTPVLVLETPALTKGFFLRYALYAKDSLDAEWAEPIYSDWIGVEKTSSLDGAPRGTVELEDPYAGSAAFYKVVVEFQSDTMLD